MTSLSSFFSDHTKLDPQSDECTPVKEYQFTFFSEYLYTWMYPLIDLGSRKPLDIEDIPNLPKYQTSLSTLQKLRRAWQEETKTVKHPSLYRAIFNSFGRYVIFGIFNCTLFVVISAIQPYFVTKLLEYISSGYAPIFGVNTGIGIAFVLGLSSIFGAFAANNGMYQFYVFGMLCRSALIGMIFEKSLNISNSVKSKSSIGEIITLMSVDVERIWVGAILLNWLWIGPLMALISMILLYFEVGYSCILVAVFLFGLGSIQEFVSKKIGQTREKLVKFTVERAKLTNEALQGIRVVKMYAWERAIGERIDSVRTQEVQLLRKYLILKITNTVLPFLGPVIMTYILFMSYVWIHGGSRHLTVRGVYAALSVLNLTRLPLAVFPLARASAEEGRKSMSRLREYFLLPEISSLVWHCDDGIPNDDVVSPSGNVENPMVPGNSDGDGADDLVYINQCTFTWQEDNDLHENSEGGEVEAVINPAGTPCTRRVRSWSGGSDSSTGVQLPPITISVPEEDITEFSSEMWGAENVVPSLSLPQSTSHLHVLSNVNLRIRRGELVGVVGSVGSGKSSLLSAILLQIRRIEGEQSLKGKVAYVSQEHWIQNRTLKDNVLFYDTADEDRYFDVMDSCQLSADLLSLPNADLTEIGERGITLSGGQKARVSIARALYFQDADLYIFDDPLAAVDAHVGRAVFEGAILSHLREKARVVSFSSNYHLLRHFDKIVVVGGKISGQVEVFDSYSNLIDAYPMYTAKAGQQDPDAGFCENGTSSDQNSDSNDAKMEPSIHRQSVYRKSQRDIEEKQQAGKVLTTIEDRERGRVSLKTVCDYFTASLDGKDGRVTVAIVLALFASTQCLRVVSDLWIGIWADDAEQGMAQHNQNFYMIYFTLLLVGTTGFVIVRSYHFLLQCLGASYSLHKQILGCVLAAPVNTYFDVTPLGRVLNRFTRDLDSVDAMLPDFFLTALQGIFHIVSVLILCILSTPYFVIVMIPLAVVFYVIQGYFRKTSRELKRLDGISRSPMYTHFGEMLAGLPTIRAYGKQKAFMDRHHTVADENKKCFFAFNITNRWLSLRLDLISTFVVLFVSLIAVIMVNMGSGVNENVLGLAVVYAIQLFGLLQWTVRTIIETENNLTSVERLLAFKNIPSEAMKEDPAMCVVGQWPTKGKITTTNLCLRYRPELGKVLDRVNLSIQGGSKIGIIGRTGAGKSSLMLALLRLVEPDEGSKIVIDDVNILDMSLETLRTGLTIIPQDPVMFSGILRYNLDPFNNSTDEEIWEALARVHLKEEVRTRFPGGLSYEVTERGENLSVGQRQLCCIARALLRKSRIIIMDEATASVDSKTDRRIQRTIREEFSHCTVLTIAHRLETVADYDMVVVMSAGTVVEAGKPFDLLQDRNGYFSGLVAELGTEARERFLDISQGKR